MMRKQHRTPAKQLVWRFLRSLNLFFHSLEELQLRVKSNLLRRFNIKKHCHKYGINMRYRLSQRLRSNEIVLQPLIVPLIYRMIGYMYLHANVEPFKLRLLIEMIARTAKNTLRALMKFTYDTEKRIETSSMNRYGRDFLLSFSLSVH